MIRVLIADDHAVVREGLTLVLDAADGLELTGAAADGEQAVALAGETGPDVVLMDLEMPRMDGIEATRRIVTEMPETRVVVLTSFADQERILDALDAGAVGYLLKDAEPAELVRGIAAADRGEAPLAPRAASAVLAARAERRPGMELSQREREVLALLAAGKPNKLIARDLEISEKTVKAHVSSIFQSLGVTDRTQAALWAKRHGLG